jgi:hypothetical protein
MARKKPDRFIAIELGNPAKLPIIQAFGAIP